MSAIWAASRPSSQHAHHGRDPTPVTDKVMARGIELRRAVRRIFGGARRHAVLEPSIDLGAALDVTAEALAPPTASSQAILGIFGGGLRTGKVRVTAEHAASIAAMLRTPGGKPRRPDLAERLALFTLLQAGGGLGRSDAGALGKLADLALAGTDAAGAGRLSKLERTALLRKLPMLHAVSTSFEASGPPSMLATHGVTLHEVRVTSLDALAASSVPRAVRRQVDRILRVEPRLLALFEGAGKDAPRNFWSWSPPTITIVSVAREGVLLGYKVRIAGKFGDTAGPRPSTGTQLDWHASLDPSGTIIDGPHGAFSFDSDRQATR